MKPQNTDLNDVRILAKQEAQKTGVDQRIYEVQKRGFRVFRFKPVTERRTGVEIVRYTKPVKVRVVPSNIEDEQLKPIKKRPAVKDTEGDS